MPSENSKDNSQDPPDNTDCIKYNIGDYDNIQDFMKDGYKTLMEAIKHSNNLPQGSDWNFYNTHDGFVKIIKEESKIILDQIGAILKTNQIKGSVSNRSIDEKTELIVEGNDNILERVAINIDEMNGIRKTTNAPIEIQNVSAELPVNGSWNRINNATFSVTSSLAKQGDAMSKGKAIRLLTAKNIIRPQKFFKDKIINGSSMPWEPRIKEKPNSLKPLAIFLEQTENGEEYSHPYEIELDRFKPAPEQLQKEMPVKPLPIADTPLIEVSDLHQLNELLSTLLDCKEFAVDLEHHSYRSFMGITCLMQISTREKDYLIDTLALRNDLHVLNEAFTKPSILKVFHGADSDILWLQRDLSLYVVNMFDTYFAAKQLQYSGLSLAYLMQRFCNFVPNKQFQLADWRIRPLPEELKSYAREDTHYLLYIYQMLKNDLLNKANGKDNLLLSVFNSSTNICKKRYFKPVLTEESHMDFYRKCKRLFDNRQLYALKELYRWRDQISREEDESTGYVLPNHMLLQIAETLPREMQGILACCNPIPPLVRANVLDLHHIILRAKEQPLEKAIFKEDTRARGITKKMSKINVDSPLNCPHDLTRSNEFRDDLPTILGGAFESSVSGLAVSKLENESMVPKCSVFDSPDNSDEEEKRTKMKEKVESFKFLSPFERYRLVRPYIQAEEEKLSKEKTKEASQESEGTERTDEDRIESIRELFLSLAKKQPPSASVAENLDRSLIQMGGKKRKREQSPLEQRPVVNHPVFLPISNDTIEDFNPRKRKSNEPSDGVSPSKSKKKNKKKQNVWENKERGGARLSEKPENQDQQGSSFSGEQVSSNQQRGQQNQRGKRHRKNQWKKNQHQQEPNSQQNRQEQDNRQNKRGSRKNNDNQSVQPFREENRAEEIEPFDYSSVDFRQFQGGAGSVQNPQNFTSKNKMKGKKSKKRGGGKDNNRSSTAGFPARGGGGNRGGRGRGR